MRKSLLERPGKVEIFFLYVSRTFRIQSGTFLNAPKTMQVKHYSQKFLVKFLLGKRTANCFKDISIFIFLYFYIFIFQILYYPLIFDVNVLEIYKICWLYLADVCLELTVMKLFLFLLCLKLLFSEGPINFCKLLFFLSLTVVPRMYLLSFFIIPEGQLIDLFQLLFIFNLNIFLLNFYYFLRLLIEINIIKDFEIEATNLLNSHKANLCYITIFYFLLIINGFLIEPQIFNSLIVLLVIFFLFFDNQNLILALDYFTEVIFHPRSFIYLIFILQFNILLYPIFKYFVTFALLMKKLHLNREAFGSSIIEMTNVSEPVINAAKSAVAVAKNFVVDCKLFVQGANNTESLVQRDLVVPASKELNIFHVTQIIAGNPKVVEFVPYGKELVNYKYRCGLNGSLLGDFVKSSDLLKQPMLNSSSLGEVILNNVGKFERQFMAELSKAIGVEDATLFRPMLLSKLGIELAQQIPTEVQGRVLSYGSLPGLTPELGKALITVDTNQLYSSRIPAENLAKSVDQILRSLSPSGVYDFYNDFSPLVTWLAAQPLGEYLIMRAPSGDFGVLTDTIEGYKFFIIECKNRLDLMGVLEQASKNLSHVERQEAQAAQYKQIKAAYNLSELPKEHLVVASKAEIITFSDDEKFNLYQVQEEYKSQLQTDFKVWDRLPSFAKRLVDAIVSELAEKTKR